MQTEKTGVIYRIYHKETMKSYVGKSVDPERRIRDHLNGHRSSPLLCNAIKKYGRDAFFVEILESDVQEAILSKMEILHIRFFNTKKPKGYNLTDGGEGARGFKPSTETRQKMSKARKGKNPWNKGKTGVYSDAHLQMLSENRKGKKHSKETRQKTSEALKGKTHSPETRQKTIPRDPAEDF